MKSIILKDLNNYNSEEKYKEIDGFIKNVLDKTFKNNTLTIFTEKVIESLDIIYGDSDHTVYDINSCNLKLFSLINKEEFINYKLKC